MDYFITLFFAAACGWFWELAEMSPKDKWRAMLRAISFAYAIAAAYQFTQI